MGSNLHKSEFCSIARTSSSLGDVLACTLRQLFAFSKAFQKACAGVIMCLQSTMVARRGDGARAQAAGPPPDASVQKPLRGSVQDAVQLTLLPG